MAAQSTSRSARLSVDSVRQKIAGSQVCKGQTTILARPCFSALPGATVLAC